MTMVILIGVKPGQVHEFSGLCAAEKEERSENGEEQVHFTVRYLERVPPRTPYRALAERSGDLVLGALKRRTYCSRLYVDVTGRGKPLVETFKRHSHGVKIVPVYFTHGDRREADWQQVRLGKGLLVARLQLLLQSGQLHLPRTPDAETLAEELQEYDIRVDEHANERYGAFPVGTRDELVTAVGLAVQDDARPESSFMRAW